MRNKKIREAAKAKGVNLWQIAECLGIADSSFSRKLRRELPDEEQQKIMGIIEQLAMERQGVN